MQKVVSTIAALLALGATPVIAADSAFLKVTGAQNGAIQGSVMQKGHEGEIKVLSISHEIVSARDPASGLATGKRQHAPLVVKKPIDRSSPLLYASLNANENLPNVRLTLFSVAGPSARLGVGVAANYYTIELVNARVASISVDSMTPGDDIERVAFTYQKIIYTYTDGGFSSEINWADPQN